MTIELAERPVAFSSVRDRLPRVDPEQARAARALFAGNPRIRLGDDAGAWLSFRPLRRAAPRRLIELAAGDETLWLEAAAAGSGDGAAPAWHDYADASSRLLAWTLAEETLLAQLGDVFGGALNPRRLVEDDGASVQDRPTLWLLARLTSADGTTQRRFALAAAPPLLLRALEHPGVQRSQDAAEQAAWRSLPAHATIVLEGPRLTAGQFRDLSPHDVIIVGRRPAAANALRLIHATGDSTALAWPAAQIDGARARISGPPQPWPPHPKEEPAMQTSPPGAPPDVAADPAADAAHPADRLPLAVEFEIGRLPMTLADVGRIEPGYVFELPQRLDDGGEVRIRINGTTVGRGELVAVGDVLGVRLTGWDAHGRRLD